VAQDVVLWYNLCEYINERMRISSLAEQPQTSKQRLCSMEFINSLNAKLNPICPLLALFEAHHILHISR